MMGGHLFGDDTHISKTINTPRQTSGDHTADIRDILTSIVGKNYKGLTDDNIRADYAKLTNLVGLTQAQNLVDTALIYNQNKSNMKLPLEQRVQGFYNQGSSDPALNTIIKSAGKFGYGPISGLHGSPDVSNQKLAGTYDELPIANKDAATILSTSNKIIK